MRTLGLLVLATLISACATTTPHSSNVSGSIKDGYLANPLGIGFQVAQSGQMVTGKFDGKYVVFDLASQPFELITKYPQIVMYIAQSDEGEVRNTSYGAKITVLNGVLSGASSPDATVLYLADAKDQLGSNNSLNLEHGLKRIGESYSYLVKTFYYQGTRKEVTVSEYVGSLFAYTWVDMNRDGKVAKEGEVARLKFNFR